MSANNGASGKEDSAFTYEQFLALHKSQLENSCVPELYWQTLFIKLKNEVFDAGNAFQIMCVQTTQDDDEDTGNDEDGANENVEDTAGEDGSVELSWKVVVSAEEGIKCEDQRHIYLIDHAWTYRIHEARSYLQELPPLVERMAALMEVKVEGREQKEVIDDIIREMWRYNQTYSIGNYELGSDGRLPVWYVMDEFGSRIQHSDNPTVRTAPFMYAPTQMAYTIMWPLQDLDSEDEVTRDYVPNITDLKRRKALLLPWLPADFKHVSYQQAEPDPEFFGEHRMKDKELEEPLQEYPPLPTDRKIRVFVDYPEFPTLTDSRFELTDDVEKADIIYIREHFKDFKSLASNRQGVYINQFPDEQVITVKDLLVTTCRRAGNQRIDPETLRASPKWLPVSYNLQTELAEFVSYFQHREEKGLDNVWIIKPWNLARSLDMTITDNLNHILRIPGTGPKLACKYITDIVTIYNQEIPGQVKFDLRFVVMLASVKPLKLYVHEKFYCRCAVKDYSLSNFDDFGIHFSSVCAFEWIKGNYKLFHEEFINHFEKQYPGHSWKSVEDSIHQMFLEIFQAATSREPPAGISHFPGSRAVYDLDVILGWDTNDKGEKVIQPYLCEVNFSPDQGRYVIAYPQLTNDIFSTLFCDDIEGRPVKLLTKS